MCFTHVVIIYTKISPNCWKFYHLHALPMWLKQYFAVKSWNICITRLMSTQMQYHTQYRSSYVLKSTGTQRRQTKGKCMWTKGVLGIFKLHYINSSLMFIQVLDVRYFHHRRTFKSNCRDTFLSQLSVRLRDHAGLIAFNLTCFTCGLHNVAYVPDIAANFDPSKWTISCVMVKS